MKQVKLISDQNAEDVATFLNQLLADEYVLYTKTRNTNWNIEGPNAFELHVFLENQSNALDLIIDDIAEQIHSLGHFEIGSMKDFLIAISITEENHDFSNSGQIIQILANDHKTLIRIIRNKISSNPDKFKNPDIVEFITSLIKQHERMARKLSSFIPKPRFNTHRHIQSTTNLQVSLQA